MKEEEFMFLEEIPIWHKEPNASLLRTSSRKPYTTVAIIRGITPRGEESKLAKR